MKSDRTDRSFQTDTRAVSQVIGFILLFGILTVAFTGYQAQVVPQQNAETEFEHFQENRDDLIDLRSAILTAGASERQQFPTVQLGTTYRTRILALNSPPPAGLLQTSDSYPINISDGNPGTDNVTVQTRFLEYQPGYHRFDIGSTWYENSVLYRDSTEPDGERVIIEDHNLVTNGDTLRITALQNEFQRSGTGRVTLELYPSSVEGNISQLDPDAELTVELPTRLDSDDWDDQFDNSDTVNYNGFNNSEFDPGVNRLDLTVDHLDNLELNTVGIREEPGEQPAKNTEPQGGANDDNGGNGDDGNGDNGQEDPTQFEFVSASNMVANSDDESQTFTFALNGGLAEGNEVVINLGDAQDGGPGNNPLVVDYPAGSSNDGTIEILEGSGSAELVQNGRNNAELTYTAGESGDSAGTEIEVVVNGIEVGDVAGEEYNVGFAGLNEEFEKITIFGIAESTGDQTITEDVDGNVYSTGSLTINNGVGVEGNAGADGSVTLNFQSEVDGSVTSRDTVTLNNEATVGENIDAGGDVTLKFKSEVDGSITSQGSVTLENEVTVGGDIDARSDVTLKFESEVDGSITSQGSVTLENEVTVGGDINAGGDVTLNFDSVVEGDVFVESGENIICGQGSTIDGDSCEDYVDENY